MKQMRLGWSGMIVVLALLSPAVGSLAVARAQDATPGATPSTMAAVHPAHIHEGTCDTLGAIVYPLSDVTLAPEAEDAATPPTQPAMVHADSVLTSVTMVDVGLTELLSGAYSINVHESVDNIGNFIACGEIQGTIRLHLRSEAPPGLVIPLRELSNSGYAGIAWLEPTDIGQTTVTIFLGEGLVGPGPGR